MVIVENFGISQENLSTRCGNRAPRCCLNLKGAVFSSSERNCDYQTYRIILNKKVYNIIEISNGKALEHISTNKNKKN